MKLKREAIYRLVGNPVPNSSLYGSVEAMMRVFVGINKRSADIHTNNTYYAIKILSVCCCFLIPLSRVS